LLWERARLHDSRKRPEEILKLSVCDPAMGSGHSLVGACRRLAEHLLGAYRTRYAEEKVRAEAAGRDAYPHELLVDAGIHAEGARVWGNCLYVVHKNPLAVELARVPLWLATAASDHPLTFLNHRLVPGDSLLGITADDLLRTFYQKKVRKALTGDDSAQGGLGLYFNRDELDTRLQRAFRFLREIERPDVSRRHGPGSRPDARQPLGAGDSGSAPRERRNPRSGGACHREGQGDPRFLLGTGVPGSVLRAGDGRTGHPAAGAARFRHDGR